MTHIRKLLPSLRRLPVLAGALALSLALAAPAGADIAFPGSAGSSLQMLHSSISSERDSPFISCRQILQYFSSSRM